MNIWIGFLMLVGCIGYIFFFYKTRRSLFTGKYGWGSLFLFFALLLSFLGFFSYQYSYQTSQKVFSSDVMFVLDVSESMLALDYGEKSRLDVAKDAILSYVNAHRENRYGLTLFAGDVTNVLPLTRDTELFSTFLQTADEKSILHGGTELFQALQNGAQRFSQDQNGGALVLVSDFEIAGASGVKKQKELSQISQLQKELTQKQIALIGIGVGNPKGNKIPQGYDILGKPIYKRDMTENEILTQFDRDFFYEIPSQKHIILSSGVDGQNMDFGNIASQAQWQYIQAQLPISRVLSIMALLSFFLFLALFSYFDLKGK